MVEILEPEGLGEADGLIWADKMARLLSVNVGLPRDIVWRGMTVHTGVWKDPVQGRRRVGKLNLDGDGQGDLAPSAGSECLLLVNGFGGTPLMELFLMVNAARRILAGRGLNVARHLTGSLVTSLDMAGCSLTVSLLDEPLIRLWDAPVKTAALSW